MPVRRINVSISFWSKNEYTNIYNSKYKIEYYSLSGYVCALDLWSVDNLSCDRLFPTNIEVDFDEPTYIFRIYSESTFSSDRNKGRLSIFDMKLFYC